LARRELSKTPPAARQSLLGSEFKIIRWNLLAATFPYIDSRTELLSRRRFFWNQPRLFPLARTIFCSGRLHGNAGGFPRPFPL